MFVISRPGSDLLSHVLRRSTIGAEDINGRVRDGIGFGVLAITTGPANNKQRSWLSYRRFARAKSAYRLVLALLRSKSSLE